MIQPVLRPALFAMMLMSTPLAAAENISTRLNTTTHDGETFSDVGFEDESCGGECYIATLSCGASGAITLELADVESRHAASAIARETQQIMLSAGGKSIDYSISEMKFQEMTGSWWVTARTQDVKAGEFAPAIAKARTITALVGKQKIVLPVDGNVKAWAAACK